MAADPHAHGTIPSDPVRFAEAIEAFRRRVLMTADEYEALEAAEREFAFTVANVAQADLVAQAYEAIERAVRDGTTLDDFKAEVGEALEEAWGGPSAARLETIFRTNVMSAYNAGRHAVMTAPAVKEARPYWRFDAIQDDRTDDECEALGGTVLPQDDGFWGSNYPPLHPNCRCVITPLSAEEAKDEGIDEEGPDVDHAADGFGSPPSEDGSDWEPDPGDYPAALGDVLEGKLSG